MCVIIHIFSHCSNRPFQCVFRWSVSNYRLCFNRSVFFNTVAPMIASFQCLTGSATTVHVYVSILLGPDHSSVSQLVAVLTFCVTTRKCVHQTL